MGRAPYTDEKGMKKGAWSTEEDDKLRAYIQRYGHWNWRELPKYAGLARCGKSCRLRWMNYLRPGVKRGNYTKDEEDLIIQLHKQLGNRWSVIATKLPGRTDNEIKNHRHTHLRKRLLQENPTFKGNKPKSTKNRELKEHDQVAIDRNIAPKSTFVPILESSSSTEDLFNTLDLDTVSSSTRYNDAADDNSPTFDSSQYSWNTLDELVDNRFWTEPFNVDFESCDDFHLNFQNVPLSFTSMLCMENRDFSNIVC